MLVDELTSKEVLVISHYFCKKIFVKYFHINKDIEFVTLGVCLSVFKRELNIRFVDKNYFINDLANYNI